MDDDVELTEFEEIAVESIKGVPTGANGFPHLVLKGVPAAAAKAGAEPGPTHGAFTGTHTHEHAANGAQGDDELHGHEHSHDGDGDHGHPHGTSKGVPAWHSPAAMLARLAKENPGTSREDLFKAVTAGGQVDEQPDIDGGQQAIALIAKLISYEADELATGDLGEIRDIGMLCDAASTLRWWINGEQASQADQMGACGCPPGCGCCEQMTTVMDSIAEPFSYEPDDVAKASREFSAEERKKHAKEGNALPDGSYPIPDKDALRRAAILARSGHGDVAAAKALIARRAKELGVPNPLDDDKDDTSKSAAVAAEETTVQTDAQETGSLAKAVEDALAKALGPLKERLDAFGADLAKVMAAPVPGGPVLSAVRPQAVGSGGDDWAAKAAYFRAKAEVVTDPAERDGYRQLAREATEKAQAAIA